MTARLACGYVHTFLLAGSRCGGVLEGMGAYGGMRSPFKSRPLGRV